MVIERSLCLMLRIRSSAGGGRLRWGGACRLPTPCPSRCMRPTHAGSPSRIPPVVCCQFRATGRPHARRSQRPSSRRIPAKHLTIYYICEEVADTGIAARLGMLVEVGNTVALRMSLRVVVVLVVVDVQRFVGVLHHSEGVVLE